MYSDQSDQDELNSVPSTFESALAGLVPVRSVDRDLLMFRAGRAAALPTARGRNIFGALTAAAALVAAAGVGVLGGWHWHDQTAAPLVVRSITPDTNKPSSAFEPAARTGGRRDTDRFGRCRGSRTCGRSCPEIRTGRRAAPAPRCRLPRLTAAGVVVRRRLVILAACSANADHQRARRILGIAQRSGSTPHRVRLLAGGRRN